MSARLKAFMLHLTGSLILGSAALAMVFLVWYPAPLDKALGVTHIFLLMLAIDVIVGPILTLIIYKPDLRLLKIDMTIIIVVQLIVFSYGIYTVAKGRPAWLVFSNDQFYLVRTADFDLDKNALPEYQHAPWTGPKWVAVNLPEDKKQRMEIVTKMLNSGRGLFTSSALYGPLSKSTVKIQAKSLNLNELQKYNSPTDIKTTLAKWPTASSWLPLWSDPQSMTVLLNKDGQIITTVTLNPWKQ